MKKTFRFLASLTLGFMIASCQNGLEEVINESEVQDELATTRAEDESLVNVPVSVDPLTISEETALAEMSNYRSVFSILGSSIIGSNIENYYYVDSIPPKTDSIVFRYTPSILTKQHTYINGAGFILTNPASTNNTYIFAYYYKNGNVFASCSKALGVNGPLPSDCSIRIVRSSDGVECYPSGNGVDANTYYYAYFTTTSGGTNMTLSWDAENASIISSYGYSAYFLTDNTGSCFINVSGSMPAFGVMKPLLGIGLY